MESIPAEFRDIGRFIRARRMASNALELPELPRRSRRHTPYVTQNELAERGGVSAVVISQIEQGKYPNLNISLLKRISQVLELNTQQEMFMLGLHTAAPDIQRGREPAPSWLIESIADVRHPVFVVNPAYDLAGWNKTAALILGEDGNEFLGTGNAVVAVFRIPRMKHFFADWNEFASTLVSGLRMSYGVHPDYREYISRFAAGMSEGDEFFHSLWMKDDPLVMPTIEKDLDHPALGHLRIIQIATVVVEAPKFTMVEWLPANEETREKLAAINS